MATHTHCGGEAFGTTIGGISLASPPQWGSTRVAGDRAPLPAKLTALPNTLEVIILFFIYAAEVLGEINNFYVIVSHWDT